MKNMTLQFLLAIVVYHNLYNSTATDVQSTLHTACDEWDRVVALPRHKFITGATLLQLHSTVRYLGLLTNMRKKYNTSF
jgi:hypothetical protein